MKKFFFYLIYLLSFGLLEDITPQEINPLDFFPHHVGDLWQYITYTQVEIEFSQIEVISVDTSYTDSSITITKFNGIQEFYFKIFFNDSLTIYQNSLGGWGILYDLDAEINSYWLSDPFSQWYTKYIGESEAVVFEDTLLSREYWIGPDTLFILPYFMDHSALGIGYFYGEFEVGITTLIGCIINGVQYGTIISVEEQSNFTQTEEYMLNNFPNPFNSQTSIHYFLPVSSDITISIFDILGREVEKLFEGEETAGHHYQFWKPDDVSSGLYFVVLRTKETQLVTKVIYLR